ncbi:MAG: hypothetical protein Q9219_004184 [cf. Caloplaca sp. 3 TL-2023]
MGKPKSMISLAIQLWESRVGEEPALNTRDDRNLADRLGLHTPFRSFATREADVIPEQPVQRDHELRKRKRRPSMTSSYLEPAICFRENKGRSQSRQDAQTDNNQDQSQHDGEAIQSISSSGTTALPKKFKKSYEKRSRYKTREDRYELKKDKKNEKRTRAKDSEKTTRKQPKKKRGRAEKSGAALMHHFSANNVETERLTLQNTKPYGLFVPDLTFSEMNFLNRHRAEKHKEPPSQSKKGRSRIDKAADAEAEISRFFASTKHQDRLLGNAGKHTKEDKLPGALNDKAHEQNRSSPPPVDLPERPFLGFGSCGPGHISPMASVTDIDRYQSPTPMATSNRSMTYYTWSQSNLSRHGRSNRFSRSSHPPGEGDTGSRPRPEKSASGRGHYVAVTRESNLQEETHTAQPGQLHDEHHPPVSPRMPEGAAKKSMTNETAKICSLEEPQPRPHNSSSAALTSLLGSQNQPELLGALLDTLLHRVTDRQAQDCHGPRPPIPSNHTEHGQFSVLDSVPEIQVLSRGNDSRPRTSLPFNGNHAEDPKTLSSPHQSSSGSQRFQSLQNANSPNTNPAPCVQPIRKPISEPIQNAINSSRKADIPSTNLGNAQTAGMVSNNSGTCNAWTGYHSLFQAQECLTENPLGADGDTNRTLPDGELHVSDRDRLTQCEVQPHNLPGDHDHNFSVYERRLSGRNSGLGGYLGHGSNRLFDINPQMHKVINETSEQAYPEELDIGQIHQGPAGDGIHASLEDVGTGLDFESHEGTTHRFSPTGFLGIRYPTATSGDDIFSTWKSHRRQVPPTTGGLRISSYGNTTYAKAADETLPSGFWKPNRLY